MNPTRNTYWNNFTDFQPLRVQEHSLHAPAVQQTVWVWGRPRGGTGVSSPSSLISKWLPWALPTSSLTEWSPSSSKQRPWTIRELWKGDYWGDQKPSDQAPSSPQSKSNLPGPVNTSSSQNQPQCVEEYDDGRYEPHKPEQTPHNNVKALYSEEEYQFQEVEDTVEKEVEHDDTLGFLPPYTAAQPLRRSSSSVFLRTLQRDQEARSSWTNQEGRSKNQGWSTWLPGSFLNRRNWSSGFRTGWLWQSGSWSQRLIWSCFVFWNNIIYAKFRNKYINQKTD